MKADIFSGFATKNFDLKDYNLKQQQIKIK